MEQKKRLTYWMSLYIKYELAYYLYITGCYFATSSLKQLAGLNAGML